MGERATPVRPPLRAVVVDDHAIVRAGLVAALPQHRVDVVGEAADVDEAERVVRQLDPDVLLLDVRLPGGGAPALLRRLGDATPPTLALSASDDRDDVVATVRAGALGYLLKTADVADVAAAAHATADGRPVFSPELAGHVMDLDVADAEVADPTFERLTDREREVLRLLARGRTYRRIGEALHVSERTIETHVRNVLRKLQVENRHEATAWAVEHGFSTDDEPTP